MKNSLITSLLLCLLVFAGSSALVAQSNEAALTALREALAADPDNYDYLLAYAGVLVIDLEEKEADSVYRRAIAVQPDRAEAYHHLAGIYLHRGMALQRQADQATDPEAKEAALAQAKEAYGQALPWMKQAHEKNPADQSTLRTLVSLCSQLGMQTEATAYNSLIK